MELNDILGYVGALAIGLVLGLIGGGGSILTVPVLVYLLAINPVTATAYSLFVVGSSSLVGAAKNFQKGRVNFKTAFYFSIPAFIRFLVPESSWCRQFLKKSLAFLALPLPGMLGLCSFSRS